MNDSVGLYTIRTVMGPKGRATVRLDTTDGSWSVAWNRWHEPLEVPIDADTEAEATRIAYTLV
jgi:hypothetical protein